MIVFLVCAAALLYLLPGLAVLRLLWPGELGLTERLALAAGVSAGLPPLALQAAHLLGLHWNGVASWAYLGVAAAIICWPHRWRGFRSANRTTDAVLAGITPPATRRMPHIHGLLLLGSVVVAVAVRVWIVRDLAVGMWGDSYQHTLMAQLLVDNGGLFQSWEPYAPLTTFTYHYGFHSNAAFLHWLTGVPVAKAVIYAGQFMNALTLPLAYVFTVRWSGERAAGLWAAVLVGFVNVQPMFYTNWGRYTQLTGQIVLLAVLVAWQAALEAPRWSWRALALAALTTGTLLLTHYIVAIFAAVFLGTYLVVLFARTPQPRVWSMLSVRAALIGVGALVIAAPWLSNTLGGYLARNVAAVTAAAGVAGTQPAANSIFQPLAPAYVDRPVLALAGIGTFVALALRRWRLALCAGWSVLLLLLVIPDVLGMPGKGAISFFAAAITLYLPLTPLAGFALGRIETALSRWRPRLAMALTVVAVLAAVGWGVRWQNHVLNPFYQLVTPADVEAMAWIKNNTPEDALFLVNMFPAYGDNLLAGDDAGWWLPYLTGRRSTLPPLTYGSERGPTPDYERRITAWGMQLHKTPLPSAEGIALCRAAGIRYIYSGAHVEHAAYRVDVAALRAHPAFRTLYDQSGVVVWELLP